MCLGQWSMLELIHDDDVKEVSTLPEVEVGKHNESQTDIEMPNGYDDILQVLSDITE